MRVQMQYCTGANYCDFVVYTKESIHIEQIKPDNSFWDKNVRKIKKLGSCLEGLFPPSRTNFVITIYLSNVVTLYPHLLSK